MEEKWVSEGIKVVKLVGNGMTEAQMKELRFYVQVIIENGDSRKTESLCSADLELQKIASEQQDILEFKAYSQLK